MKIECPVFKQKVIEFLTLGLFLFFLELEYSVDIYSGKGHTHPLMKLEGVRNNIG